MTHELLGHTSESSAYLVEDYPYGFRLRCRIRYWLEEDPKKGFRFVSQTENPKNMRWNAPKKSTLTPEEIRELHPLTLQNWGAMSSYLHWHEKKSRLTRGMIAILMRQGERIVAWCSLRKLPKFVEINIFVSKEHRGKWFGTSIANKAKNCVSRRWPGMAVEAMGHDRRSKQFWYSQGFVDKPSRIDPGLLTWRPGTRAMASTGANA